MASRLPNFDSRRVNLEIRPADHENQGDLDPGARTRVGISQQKSIFSKRRTDPF
jgi:hypothetical protein